MEDQSNTQDQNNQQLQEENQNPPQQTEKKEILVNLLKAEGGAYK